MLEEMFLYTKLTDEDYSLSLRKLQVLPLLSECLLSLYTSFEEAGISPNVAFQSEGFQVNADEDALKRVFLNLLLDTLWLDMMYGSGYITLLPGRFIKCMLNIPIYAIILEVLWGKALSKIPQFHSA